MASTTPSDRSVGDAPETTKPWWKRYLLNPWVIAFVVGAATLMILRPFLRHIPEPPPVLATLPDYELVNQEGEGYGSEELAGDVYVVNFFFTSCPSICPPMMQKMLTLQDKLEAADVPVRLVSISVDPENDTPAVLEEYGEKLGSDFERWTYLTGPEEEVRELIVDGFQTHLGEKKRDENNVIDIAHVGKVVLVDQKGRIRGFYDSSEDGMEEVFHRSQHVLQAEED